MAPYSEKFALAFLKDMGLEMENILKQAQSVTEAVERLHRDYIHFIEDNPDISHLEAFKNLERDLRSLCQTCRFVPKDCQDVRHSIAECGIALN
jgi:archaellum component FlaC